MTSTQLTKYVQLFIATQEQGCRHCTHVVTWNVACGIHEGAVFRGSSTDKTPIRSHWIKNRAGLES